jgi:hypothetical protein
MADPTGIRAGGWLMTCSSAATRSGARACARVAAFTLIEVLAAVLLTTIVLTVAVSIFINISDATTAATSRMREARHAIAILDRIAHDFESAYLLVKPPEMDPFDHPWLFIGESEYSDGSDRMKFVIRNQKRRSSAGHSSDLAVVSYALVADEFGSFDLVRAAKPNLPDRLEREIPIDEEDGAMLLAEGVRTFSVRFMTEEGEWQDTWDSSQMLDSGALPLAAEVDISFVDPDAPEEDFDAAFDGEDDDSVLHYKRRVAIPMRPLALSQQLDDFIAARDGAARDKDGDGEDDPEGSPKFKGGECEMTWPECAARHRSRIVAEVGEEKYEECVVASPYCVEDVPGRKFCGVSGVICQ